MYFTSSPKNPSHQSKLGMSHFKSPLIQFGCSFGCGVQITSRIITFVVFVIQHFMHTKTGSLKFTSGLKVKKKRSNTNEITLIYRRAGYGFFFAEQIWAKWGNVNQNASGISVWFMLPIVYSGFRRQVQIP